jgi:basic membrane protein A and related proteins
MTCRRSSLALFGVAGLVLAFLVAGCAPSVGGCQPGDLRVGMVTDTSGIDGSANALVWQGIQRAEQELDVCAQFLESRTEEDYPKSVTGLADQHFDVIVASGPALSGTVQEMAGRYPATQFVVVDDTPESDVANVHGITYRVDQAAFPAGYLAAAWADLEDPADPRVGYVASRRNPSAELYVRAFKAGVDYYNAQKDRTVRFRGVYVGEDEDSLYAQEQANSLIDLGADVLLDVGDEAPIGALTMAKERGKWGIGSGLDQYQALPGERTILLTSAVKRPDTAVYAFLEQMRQGDLSGTSVEVGTLENGGVGLAPYHDTDRQIPDWLKQEVAEIEEAIQEGRLDTGLQLP